MGSDESHFNISLIVRDKVTRQRPQTTTFEEKGEPKPYRTEVLSFRLPAYRLTARPNWLSRAGGVGGCEEGPSGFLDASTGAEAGVCLGSCSPKCGRLITTVT